MKINITFLILLFLGFNNLIFSQNKDNKNFKKLIKKGALIVDVRTKKEYSENSYKGSVNIPLDLIEKKADSLKSLNKKIILVCRSGNRSKKAKDILKAKNIKSFNGGSWDSL